MTDIELGDLDNLNFTPRDTIEEDEGILFFFNTTMRPLHKLDSMLSVKQAQKLSYRPSLFSKKVPVLREEGTKLAVDSGIQKKLTPYHLTLSGREGKVKNSLRIQDEELAEAFLLYASSCPLQLSQEEKVRGSYLYSFLVGWMRNQKSVERGLTSWLMMDSHRQQRGTLLHYLGEETHHMRSSYLTEI